MQKYAVLLLVELYLIVGISNYRTKKYRSTFKNGDKIKIISGTVNSYKTQIPYDLDYLDICVPEDRVEIPKNLGEKLLSGKSYETRYEISINENITNKKKFCTKTISRTGFHRINSLINKGYFINYYLDNLPAGLEKTDFAQNTKQVQYNIGIPIGFVEENITYINNYYIINVELNEVNRTINETIKNENDNKENYIIRNITGYEIIGFTIEPFSIKINENEKDKIREIVTRQKTYEKQIFNISEEIIFSYDIMFSYTNTTYEERFNQYFYVDNMIHWSSLMMSGVIIFILTILLICIYIRSIQSEIEIHNERVTSDDLINEYGWRNIAFDVFRRPYRSDILASFFGTGIQLLVMTIYALFFVSLGIIQPKNGGSYFSLLVMVYIFLSLLSGYYSSRFYKMVHGINWLRVTIITAFFFPLIFIILLTITNLLYWLEGSTTYVEFKNLFSLVSLWIIGTVPLIFLGTIIGLSQKRIEVPCDVNPVPSSIPVEEIPWYLRIRFSWFITGFPSFFSVFVELFYIMDSLWKQNIYALSKYLLTSLIILIITSSEIGILFSYLNLCKGDYRWWWKSFFVSASPGLYIIVFSILYLFKMELTQLSSIIIYLNFMTLISVIISLICGASGLLLTFLFVKNIYSKIKLN